MIALLALAPLVAVELVGLLVTLIILGLIFWLVTAYLIPLIPSQPFRTAVLIVFILIAILVLLQMAGYGPGIRL